MGVWKTHKNTEKAQLGAHQMPRMLVDEHAPRKHNAVLSWCSGYAYMGNPQCIHAHKKTKKA